LDSVSVAVSTGIAAMAFNLQSEIFNLQ